MRARDDPDSYVLSIAAYETPPQNPNLGTRLSEYWFDFIDDVRDFDTPPLDYANLIDDGQAWSGFNTTTVTPGETTFSVWSEIRNIGTVESGIFQVSYYASTDTEITVSDYLIGTVSVSSLLPFNYEESEWSGNFPSDIPSGTYWVGWIIDITGVVPEPLDDGENNNIAYKDSYQLTVALAENTDPSVTWVKAKEVPGPRLDPGGEVETGGKVLLYSRVGDAETPPSELTVSISYRPQGGEWTTEVATYNEAWNYWRIDWVIPGDAVPGLYDVKVDVEDPDGGTSSTTEIGEFSVI